MTMTREEAITILKDISWQMGSVKRWENIEAIDMAIEALQKEAERQEMVIRASEKHLGIVRCKDCRFWKNEHLCLVMSRYGSIDTKAEHYCSWGERKEEGIEKGI